MTEQTERERVVAMLKRDQEAVRRFIEMAKTSGKTDAANVLGVQDSLYSDIIKRIERGDHLKGTTDD